MPSDLKTRFNKNRVVVSLHTRFEGQAPGLLKPFLPQIGMFDSGQGLDCVGCCALDLGALMDCQRQRRIVFWNNGVINRLSGVQVPPSLSYFSHEIL